MNDVEGLWRRECQRAKLAEMIQRLRRECRAAYHVWDEMITKLHKMEIELEKYDVR